MKSSKKYYKPHSSKSSSTSNRHYFQQSAEQIIASDTTKHAGGGSSGENSSQQLLAETTSPAIAIVTPTARNPATRNVNINHNCKTGSTNIIPQITTAVPPRTMHVQHHIHHIQPVQISTTSSPAQYQATGATSQLSAAHQPWPVVEPAFHFGSGFEIHQSYCPTHSHSDQHVVLFHLSPGVAVSFQIAGGHKIIQGPVTVPMVSQSGSPPIPMPVQVPPGHVMQQIVDENGTLRHVILSTQHQQIQSGVQHHIHGHYITANGTAPQYYNPIAGYPPPTNQASSANQLYPTMTHQQLSHSPSPPSNVNNSNTNNNNNNSSSSNNNNNSSSNNNNVPLNNNNNNNNNNNSNSNANNYQNNERAQRQYNKLIRKLESRNMSSSNSSNQSHSQSSRNNNNNSSKNDNLNGTSSSSGGNNTLRRTTVTTTLTSSSAPPTTLAAAANNLQRNGTSSTGGTSDDGEFEESSSAPDEEDDTQILIEHLSSIEPPVVKEIQSHTALVTWEAPPQSTENALVNLNANDIRYEILLGDRGKDGKYKSIFRGTNLSCRIQDLRAGQEYHVCLSARLDDIKGSETEPIVFRTPAREPETPTQPKVLAKTKNSLQLRWNAPVDNGSHIIHYILEMSTEAEGGEFTELCKIKGKQFTVNKLTPATWYTFRLAAVNECGRSEWTAPISYNTDGYPPPQPLAPRLHNVTTSSITLLWNRRREDGDFILQMSSQGPQAYMNVYYGPEIIYECTRLQRATAYQFRLASKTDAGQSTWSDEITIATLPEQPGRPSKPQVKGKIHAYSFKVKWDPPHDRGGADIKCYHLEISSGAIFERIYSGASSEAICDRLSPGTTYQVRVLCEGPGGISAPSDTSTITTEAIVPNAPKTPYYSNLPGPYAAVLQWEKPHYQGGAPVTEYELELEGILNDGIEKKKQRTIVYRGKETYCVVKDLLPGESYLSHVRAVNRIGAGEWSEEFLFRAGSAPPSKPLAPEIQIRSATHLLVKWHEPASNGAPISDYKLESSSEKKQEEDAFTIVYHGTETSADLRDLLPFTTYFFRLHAINAAGRSPNSQTVCQKTPAAVPGMPTLLPDLFAITSNTAYVCWKEPESNGDAIISYVLECGDRQVVVNERNQTNLLIEHLSPEQVYKVRVQAVNSIGAGAFCAPLKVLTKPLPPKAPRLECIQYGFNSLKLKWGSDSGIASSQMMSKSSANVVDFQRFYVEMKIKSSSKDFQNIYTGTRNSIKVQKLHESTDYAFRICAQTEHAGTGTWSDEYYFRTQAAQPNGVKIIRCNENFPVINVNDAITTATLTVEWQHSKNNHFNDSVEYILQKAATANVNSKNLQYDEIYRGTETRFSELVEYDTDYSFRVIPVRVMKSKRTTSICSSSTRNSDEVDGRQSSDDDESDTDESSDENNVKPRNNDVPITFEYVYGTASPAYHCKLSKSAAEAVQTAASSATNSVTNSTSGSGASKKQSSKANTGVKLAQTQAGISKKHFHVQQQQQSHKAIETETNSIDSSDDEKSTETTTTRQSLFLNLLKAIREFFYNRNNWSVTEESIIIWFGFMFFAIIVGCILHFLMA